MKLLEIYSTPNELDDVISELKSCENHCECKGVFKVELSRTLIGDLRRTSEKSKEALKALLDELEIGNKQN